MRQPIKFGNYLLLERIAVGGMAEVFVAKAFGAEGFQRLVAIKKILPTMGEDAEFIRMFVDEARLAVQLAHANIVQVLELGKHDESLYIAMEYVSGRDLRQLMERFRKRQQPMPLPQACLIVGEVCEALDHAHRKRDALGRPLGIVHRDVSPQNVLVSFDGEVKLIDFGIAKAETRLQKRTQAGILKGKFSYMSPEQVKGQALDGRSDIFACGILLWELACGEKLFTGDSDYAVLEKVRLGAVPPPRSRNPACPEALEKVILKALATDSARRYQTASELHDELAKFTVGRDAVFGSRQLAEWIRDEFKSEVESEQQRLRAWLAVEAPGGREPRHATASGSLPAVIVADLTQTPRAPAPGDSNELPTIQLDDIAVAAAEKSRFDFQEESTKAPRAMRTGPLSRPLRDRSRRNLRRFGLYAAASAGLAVAAVAMVLARREPAPGKVIVTPSPPVAAELIVDGRPSGPLPPFVHTLALGKHHIEVRAEGYKPFSATVDVASTAMPVELAAKLEPDRPLTVEGVILTPSPSAAPPAVVPPPPAKLKPQASRKPNRAPEPVAPVEPLLRTESPPLAAATPVAPAGIGYLVVQSKPAARLTIDGRETGRWTPVPAANPIVLPAGSHTVVFESADGRRHEEQVEIEAGKTARFVRALPP
jgi:serine/threonine protein kinase